VPLVALSALPVLEVNGQFETLLGLPPEQGGYANDPVLRGGAGREAHKRAQQRMLQKSRYRAQPLPRQKP